MKNVFTLLRNKTRNNIVVIKFCSVARSLLRSETKRMTTERNDANSYRNIDHNILYDNTTLFESIY